MVSLVECFLSNKRRKEIFIYMILVMLLLYVNFVSNCLIFLCCRYLVCMSGLDAIQCPQNFGSCHLHLPFIQVCILFLVACVKPAFSSAIPIINFINAGNLLGYCRLTYLPMAYLYGKRFVGPITPLILQIREEIYNDPYEKLNWRRVRHLCAKVS